MTPPNQTGTERESNTGIMGDQAVHWLLRQRAGDMDAAEWEAFTLWLEEDQRHPALFDELAVSDAALDQLAARIVDNSDEAEIPDAANDNPIRRFVPWAMASAAAAILAIVVWPAGDPAMQTFATQPGETKVVALTDEITMTLNGASEVSVSEGEPYVNIERGEVAFAIDADEPSALRVNVADLVLTDYGTVFNVALSADTVSVAVAEGIVAVNPDAEEVQILAGQMIEKAFDSPILERREVDSDIVGAWREGRLEFDDTPIDDALLQLQRSSGMKVSAAQAFSNVRLTGSVLVSDSEADIAASLAGFVGGTARRDENAWVIE